MLLGGVTNATAQGLLNKSVTVSFSVTVPARGKPIVYKGLDGKTYTQTGPAQISGVSCSVSVGNAFAS